MSHRFNPFYCIQIILNLRMNAGNKSVFQLSWLGDSVDVIGRSISQVYERLYANYDCFIAYQWRLCYNIKVIRLFACAALAGPFFARSCCRSCL